MNRSRLTIAIVMGYGLLASGAWAVKTATWTHEQPKDFSSAELKDVVVSSRGEVTLGREIKVLHKADKKADVVNALAQAGDGRIYAATGPGGIIFRLDGEQVSEFATLPDGNVFSLLFTQDGKLLAGTGGGSQAKIYTIDGKGKATVFYEPKNANYVWAMARGPKGEVYAATGDDGELHVVDADGKNGKVLADIKSKNLLCLAFGADNMLYAGTDEDGLVYRIDPQNGKTYVMYDASEAEISSIVIDGAGNIYAATAAVDQARPGRGVADKPGGKPDNGDDGATKPAGTQPAAEDKKDDAKPAQAESALARALAARATTTKPTARGTTSGSEAGNVIYRIDTFGFVTPIFREPVMILDMAEEAGTIYAVTGNEGRVYAVTPNDDRTTMLAKLDPNQATAVLRQKDGGLIVGTANIASLVRISQGFASKGTLVSEPLDASQIVKWGRLSWAATAPNGTKLTFATRSGNVGDKESSAWEDWSAEMDATTPAQIASSGARFLQYRLTFESNKADATPLLWRVGIPYVEDNRPPVISGMEFMSAAKGSEKPGTNPKVKQAAGQANYGDPEAPIPEFTWYVSVKAADPNQDTLVYEVYYRQVGRGPWIRLAKELKEPLHIWDTRTVPDGKYEVRVVADDRLANAAGAQLTDARISDPVILDNTPPEVAFEKAESSGKGRVTVQATVTDALTPVAAAAYQVDSQEEWRMVPADDEIFDSLRERLTFAVDDLEVGDHWVALRVSDDQGNTRYASTLIKVEP